jgi:hypothetical protein
MNGRVAATAAACRRPAGHASAGYGTITTIGAPRSRVSRRPSEPAN